MLLIKILPVTISIIEKEIISLERFISNNNNQEELKLLVDMKVKKQKLKSGLEKYVYKLSI